MRKLIALLLCLLPVAGVAQTRTKGVFIDESVTVTFSATPTFDASKGNMFTLTLTANVTSSTLSNARAGQELYFKLCQDATGSRTFVAPANVQGMGTIVSTANACSTQQFWFDGTNALASAPMLNAGNVIMPANVTVPAANTLTVNNVRQASGSSFVLADPNGVSHFFISGSAPYVNTFVQGNGSGSVFLGSAAKTSVDDATGHINMNGATSGTITLQVPAVAGSNNITFPAATDTLVGKATTDTLTNKTLTSPIITTPTMNGTVINGVPSVMQFSCTGTASPATTLSLSGGPCTNTTGVLFPVSSTATIANLRCKSQGAGVNASSGAMTVRKNGVAQTTTCTIGTGTTCSDVTHTFSVAAADTVDLIFTTQAAETLSNIGCTVEKQ